VKLLKYERIRRGLAQESVGIAARIDQSALAQIELGHYIPGPRVLGRLAAVLGVPSHVLLEEVEIVQPETRPSYATTGRSVGAGR
jgi:transcriptional regulator with XRE-family HTH domain